MHFHRQVKPRGVPSLITGSRAHLSAGRRATAGRTGPAIRNWTATSEPHRRCRSSRFSPGGRSEGRWAVRRTYHFVALALKTRDAAVGAVWHGEWMQLIRAVACVVVGPLYALQSDSVLGVGLGLLVTGVGAFLVLDEFGWDTARLRQRRGRKKTRQGRRHP